MLKGISLSMRDSSWHNHHLVKLKRRKGLRKQHLLTNKIQLAKRIKRDKKTQEQIEKNNKKIERRNRISWLLLRLWWWVADLFRRIINIFKTKDVKTKNN